MSLVIKLFFTHYDSDTWHEKVLLPEEYFDVDEYPFEMESASKYDHAIEYLDSHSKECIKATKLEIIDRINCQKRLISEMFWNAGLNRIIERNDEFQGTNVYWELIMDVQISQSPNIAEVIRICRMDGMAQTISHVFIERSTDGSERETCIYPS